jgi:hypothetical protein
LKIATVANLVPRIHTVDLEDVDDEKRSKGHMQEHALQADKEVHHKELANQKSM